jgi:hypothetical protein
MRKLSTDEVQEEHMSQSFIYGCEKEGSKTENVMTSKNMSVSSLYSHSVLSKILLSTVIVQDQSIPKDLSVQ